MRLPDQHDRGTLDAPDRRLDRIVVGVDFTESSLAVAQWVGRHLARAAELLVHVTPMAMMPNVARAGSNRLAIVDGRSSDRVRSLRGALRGLASLIVGTRTAVDVRVGDPATQLAAYANMVDADLVVVAGSTKYHVAPHTRPRQPISCSAASVARYSSPATCTRRRRPCSRSLPTTGMRRRCSPPQEWWR
jgi:hypothetical protein